MIWFVNYSIWLGLNEAFYAKIKENLRELG
jgi:hypothetical protein